jgi:hypothetical protein
MKDDVRTAYGDMRSLVGPQVALDHGNLKTLKAFASASGKVVEDADVVATGQEPTNEVVADEASASRHEREHLSGHR